MIHEVVEGVQEQTTNEQIAYGVDCGDYPGTPTSVISVTAWDISDPHLPLDVSEMVLNGTPSITSSTVVTPAVASLTAGRRYRVRMVYASNDNNRYETYFDIECKM